MGLMDQAVTKAHQATADNRTAIDIRIRKKAAEQAKEISSSFGIEAVWLDQVEIATWHKNYSDFGGYSWKPSKTYASRFQLDDIVIGRSETRNSTHYWLWKSCPKCGETRPFNIGHVYTWGDDTAKHLHELLTAFGKVINSKTSCTNCLAQPCETCGQTR